MIESADDIKATPDTPAQKETTRAGQRRINLIWELTQAGIAISITGALIFCELTKVDSVVLKNAFFLVVAMYLVRTNHTLTGGTGPKNLNEPR